MLNIYKWRSVHNFSSLGLIKGACIKQRIDVDVTSDALY